MIYLSYQASEPMGIVAISVRWVCDAKSSIAKAGADDSDESRRDGHAEQREAKDFP